MFVDMCKHVLTVVSICNTKGGVIMAFLTPMKAIRKKCLDCSGTAQEVRLCTCEDNCPLWPYRFGHRPVTDDKKQPVSEEKKAF